MADTEKMSGPELASSEEERINKLRYEFNKEVEEVINTSNDLKEFMAKYKTLPMNVGATQQKMNRKTKSKKAKGGYVKKYANGGSVRKVRR